MILDPEGQSVPPAAFNTFDECPFPPEIKEEALFGHNRKVSKLASICLRTVCIFPCWF